MRARDLARFTAICRLAIGAGFLAYPPLTMRSWIGADARRPGAILLARALGARDLVLALGTLASLSDSGLSAWLRGALAADTADLALTLLAGEQVSRRGRILVCTIAGAGVALGAAAVITLED